MDLTYIVMLVVAMIAAGMIVVMINNAAEQSRLKRLRLAYEAAEKAKVVRSLSLKIPGQMMSVELKTFLTKLELSYFQIQLKYSSDRTRLKARVNELNAALTDIKSLLRENIPVAISSREVLEGVRGQIASLQGVIKTAYGGQIITHEEATRWVPRLRKMLVQTNLDLFTASASHEMHLGFPRKAKLVLEQAVKFIQALPNSHLYAAELLQFKAALESAEKAALEIDAAARAAGDSNLEQLLDQMSHDESSDLKRAF